MVKDPNREVLMIARMKWSLLAFFAFRLACAVAMFCICMWIRFELDFRVWVKQMDWRTYWYCMYVIMMAMVFEMGVSLVGGWGVIRSKLRWLTVSAWFMFFLAFVEFTGAVLILVYGIEESNVLVMKQLDEKLREMVYKWDTDPRAAWALKQIMEYVHCCGADGAQDFINAYKPVPVECRDQITGNEYPFGCRQQLAWWLEPWSCCLAAFCIFFVITDFPGWYVVRKLRRKLEWAFDQGVYDDYE